MSYSFTVSQPIGNPSSIIFIDTSTDIDPNVSERHIYLQKADGTFLVPTGSSTDYIIWPLAYTTFEITGILEKDRALNITVEWDDGDVGFITINGTDYLLINSVDKIFI